MDDRDLEEVHPRVLTMLADPGVADLAWIRERVQAEIAARRPGARWENEGCGETLHALALLLHRVGEPIDARLIWEAKRANMDCGATIEGDLLTMGTTLAALRDALDPIADRALLERAAQALEHPDHDDLVGTLLRYYGLRGA